MKKTFWVLTEAYNQYDQYGDYLISVWSEKPTIEQLMKLAKGLSVLDEPIAMQLLESGSTKPDRCYDGASWYILSELKEGSKY